MKEYIELGEAHFHLCEEIAAIEARLTRVFLDSEQAVKEGLEESLKIFQEKMKKMEKRLDYLEAKCYK
jgi:hypothetical protein